MQNGTMIQLYHWYTPADGNFWKEVKQKAKLILPKVKYFGRIRQLVRSMMCLIIYCYQ